MAGIFQVPRIELSMGAPCLLNDLMKDGWVDGGGARKRPCEWQNESALAEPSAGKAPVISVDLPVQDTESYYPLNDQS